MKNLKILFFTLAALIISTPAFSAVTITKLSTYQSNVEGFEARIVTPLIRGLTDKKLQSDINENFRRKNRSEMNKYEEYLLQRSEESAEIRGYFSVISDFIVKTDNEDILAIDCYLLNIVGSSSTTHNFYTFDKKKGELITLKNLLKQIPNYESKINRYIKSEMKRMNKKENGMFWIEKGSENEFKSIKEDQNFYINKDGELVICFDKYEVAAGAQGSPEFIIPANIIKIQL